MSQSYINNTTDRSIDTPIERSYGKSLLEWAILFDSGFKASRNGEFEFFLRELCWKPNLGYERYHWTLNCDY